MSGALQAVYMNQRSFTIPPYFFGRVGTTSANTNTQTLGVAFNSSKNIIYVGNETPVFPPSPFATVFSISNSDKTTVFQKQYSVTAYSIYFSFVAVDSSNNIYCAGYNNFSGGYASALLTKLNSSGVLQWSRTLYSTIGFYFYSGVGVDSSGNVYVGGSGKYDSTSGVYNFIIAKYNSSGTLQWQRKLEQSGGNNVAAGFYVDSSGNSYITGYSNQSGTYYGYVAKYDSSGTIQWQRQFIGGGNNYANANGVTVDSSGNVYVSGAATGSDSLSDGHLIKYNSSGTVQWQRRFTKVALNPIAVDSSGNVFSGGEINAASPYKGSLVKYNSSGTIQWQREINATLSGQNFKYWWGTAAINSDGDLGVNGITGQAAGGANNNLGMIGLFPNDGAFTGTYTVGGTAYTISAGTQTDAAGTTTSSTASLTDAAGVLTGGSQTLTEASNSAPIALVNVP